MTTFSIFSIELSHVTQPKTASELKENQYFSQSPTTDFIFSDSLRRPDLYMDISIDGRRTLFHFFISETSRDIKQMF